MKPMPSLKTVTKLINHAIASTYPEGPTEFDQHVNKLSRALIRAYKREHGQAFLGRINLYQETRHLPVLQEYRKGIVRNFSCSVLLPTDDIGFKRMVLDRDRLPYLGTKDDYDKIKEIFDRLDNIGGQSLNWV